MGALCTHLSEFCLPPLKSFRGIDSSTRRTFLLTLENGQRVILKQKRELKTCLREYELLKRLNDMNIPVAMPITSNTGQSYFFDEQKIYCLYPYVKGRPLSSFHTKNGIDKCVLLGQAIARLHVALSQLDDVSEFPVLDFASSIKDKYRPFFRYYNDLVDPGFVRFLEIYEELLPSAYEWPVHLVHGDMNPANILFSHKVPVCYLDFEEPCICLGLYDICYCALNILIEGFDSFKQRDWFNLFSALIDGYNSVTRLANTEIRNLLPVMCFILIQRIAYCVAVAHKPSIVLSESVFKWITSNIPKMM